MLAGLIEHESCISLKHSRCWDPTSRLKSPREEGAGFFQLTRAYHADGRLRFDVISELKTKHPELRELTWHNVYHRPDLQMRAGLLKLKGLFSNFSKVTDTENALAFTDAAFNGGEGGVNNERRACQISSSCNPKIWFDNVERFCLKSKAALYGNRNACDINRHHVRDVFRRTPKYLPYFK